jgi:hypothetical protein
MLRHALFLLDNQLRRFGPVLDFVNTQPAPSHLPCPVQAMTDGRSAVGLNVDGAGEYSQPTALVAQLNEIAGVNTGQRCTRRNKTIVCN